MPSTADGRRRGRTSHRADPPGRRNSAGPEWNEYLSSAAVILAGVLVVIGFGFVAAHGLSRPEKAPPLDPPAPALGDVRVPAPAGGQGLIPLASPTPTTPATTPPTTRPPSRDQLRIAQGPVPGKVDLSEEGESDWVHWGLNGTYALERDKGGEFRILEGTPTAPRFRHSLSPQTFTWSGGDPVATTPGTRTGIRTCGQGNGFTLTAPAGTTPRILKIYLGTVSARGKLTARLSTGKSTGSTLLDNRGGTLRTAVVTVAYQAPRSGQVRLTWTTDVAYGEGCAGVALEAATLS